MPGNFAGLLMLVLLGGCASVGATEPSPAPQGAMLQETSNDCFTIGDVAGREACFARMSAQELAECAKFKPLACVPYRDMQAENKKVESLMAEIAGLSRKTYASYAQEDAAYLDDLMKGLKDADLAWKNHRDAHCLLEPFLDGMARREAGDLTEACRLDLTRKRVSELEAIVSSLKAKGES